MIVRFDNKALKARKFESSIGVEGDNETGKGISEADAIVSEAAKHQHDTGEPLAGNTIAGRPSIPEAAEEVETKPVPKLDPNAPKNAVKNS
jgi:protein phosphatase PTC1